VGGHYASKRIMTISQKKLSFSKSNCKKVAWK